MKIHKLSSTDAFVAIDYPDAQQLRGIVRCAKKILLAGAINLGRSATYTYARFEVPASGASVGINAVGDDVGAAVANFAEELGGEPALAGLRLVEAKGVDAGSLGSVGVTATAEDRSSALAAGVAAATMAHAAAESPSVVIESCPQAESVAAALRELGAEVSEKPLSEACATPADVLIVGSGPAVLDHAGADAVAAKAVVPMGRLALTTRALATCTSNGVDVVADFVACSASELIEVGLASDVADACERIARVVQTDRGAASFVTSCEAAEAFLLSWTDELPFGRPLP